MIISDIFRLISAPIKAFMFTIIFVNQLVQLAMISGGVFLLWKMVIEPFMIGK
jgi:hypothetical protein